jgi:1-deoxy-D-xylulose-5-phosphate synthase
MNYLSQIQDPEDLRALAPETLTAVVQELRDFIIHAVATKEGHLGASLGVVELTVALHYVFNTPQEPLIWDVGHQAYGHKILTGRRDLFESNRQWGGISGFPSREESVYDPFGVGHSSTGISAALGMALAALEKTEKTHIVVVGDAAIASGMALEGLNHAGDTKANLLVILNDNQMGIDPAVGALKKHFNALSKASEKLQNKQESVYTNKLAYTNPLDQAYSLTHSDALENKSQNIFTALGFSYTGVVDGHDLDTLLAVLKTLKQQKGPRVLHIKTTKGKGLSQAEADQVGYHAPGKFNVITGERMVTPAEGPAKYQDVFGASILELAYEFPEIMAITPAMPTGSSLKYMMEIFPERALDVGIAEQHAVTLAAGMAAAGKLPYCVIYSTFLQRAYDQLIHDVALQNLPVVFCIDRAGIVGQDGATHHGVFDLAFLLPIPNMVIAAPSDEGQLRNLLYTAAERFQKNPKNTGPMAIRYPRGAGVLNNWKNPFISLPIGKGAILKKGNKIAILSIGPIKHEITEALHIIGKDPLQETSIIEAFGHFDMIFAKPLDHALLDFIKENYSQIVTLEDGVISGGFGASVAQYIGCTGQGNSLEKITHWGVPDTFIGHGKPEKLYKSLGLDAQSLALKLLTLIS